MIHIHSDHLAVPVVEHAWITVGRQYYGVTKDEMGLVTEGRCLQAGRSARPWTRSGAA